MSTIGREPATGLLPLVEGERLDRATFHARYEAMPEGTRAELIDGKVEMMAAAGMEHGDVVWALSSWLAFNVRGVPGLRGSQGPTVFINDRNQFEPDLLMRVLPEFGGRLLPEGRYLSGAPELVIEVSHSTRAKDLGRKFREYERAGVQEYLVVTDGPDEAHWFVRREDQLVPLQAGADGWFRSEVFPGLWLDPAALFDADMDALANAVEQGKATPEHADFVARMRGRRGV